MSDWFTRNAPVTNGPYTPNNQQEASTWFTRQPKPPSVPAEGYKLQQDNSNLFSKISSNQSDIGYIIPHGSEKTAKEVLNNHLKNNPGVALVNSTETRNLNGTNTNQVFGENTTNHPLRKQVDKELINNPFHKVIIALHNTKYNALAAEKNRSDEITYNQPGNTGYLLTTNPSIYNHWKQTNAPYNLILQTNQNDPKDNSLSKYMGQLGKSYINVEAEEGDKEGQTAMLERAIEAYRNTVR